MKIVGVEHTSYTVSNLERSLEFYVGVMGCKVLWQRQNSDKYCRDIVAMPEAIVNAAHLAIPGTEHHLELFEYVQPAEWRQMCGTTIRAAHIWHGWWKTYPPHTRS